MTTKPEPTNKPRTALVTGGSRRIGKAIVLDLAAAGVDVAIHFNTGVEEAEMVAAEVRKLGVRAIVLRANLALPGEVEALFSRARAGLGAIDLLVNNASVFENDSALAPDLGLMERHMHIHVTAPVLLTAALAAQPDIDEGLAVNMIDQRVWRLNPNFFSYTLSKSALWTATRTMAQAHAPRIRVNAIGPGPALPNERQSEADFRKQEQATILGRGPDLSEFGATILHFWRMKSVTGQMIALDGGQHLAWETPDVVGIRE